MFCRNTPVLSRLRVIATFACLAPFGAAVAGGQSQAPAPADSGAGHHDTGSEMGMHPAPLGISMTRSGSGTSWLPEASPMHAQLISLGTWDVMVHGVEYGMFDQQYGGSRGANAVAGVGWLMGAATHVLPVGEIGARLASLVDHEPEARI